MSSAGKEKSITDAFSNRYNTTVEPIQQAVESSKSVGKVSITQAFQQRYSLKTTANTATLKEDAEPVNIPKLILPQPLPSMIYPAHTEDKLKKSLSQPQLLMDLQQLLHSSQQHGIRIVNTGLLKAGKSTLYNCLVDAVGEERFKTGTVRTTMSRQEYQYGDFIYIDTPGIDHVGEETAEAITALKTADIVLFIHNLKSGELDKSEVAFLQDIAKHWGNNQDFIKRTIFVMTHLADVEAQASAIIAQIEKQITHIFTAKPMIKSISATRYRKGFSEHKKVLIERSGIPALVACLHHQANTLSADISQQRITRLHTLMSSIEKDIKASVSQLQTKKQLAESNVKKAQVEFNDGVNKINKEVTQMFERYNAI